MTAGDRHFHGTIADVYDRLLVPLLFEFYAADLASRVAMLEVRDVLETAAGTGVLTRQLAAALVDDTRIVATDLNKPMLDLGKARCPDSRIQWRCADALELPFEPECFDAVVCQFGVMFFPDKARAFREVLRVLKPGGHFLFNAWDRISENEFAHAVVGALGTHFHRDPPDFLARIPHGYHDVGRIQADLEAAGLEIFSIETVAGISRAASPRDSAVAYCQGTPTRNEIEGRDPSGLEEATEAVTRAMAQRFGDGPIDGRMQAHVIHCCASAGR